jgi:hypothetical protein
MAKDPREQQRTDAERIPDERPGPLDADEFEPVEIEEGDDLEPENDDVDDDDLDEDLEEV